MNIVEIREAITAAHDGGDLEAAVGLCRQGLVDFPEDADLLFDLGRVLLAAYNEGLRDGTLREAFTLSLDFGELDFPATDFAAAALKSEAMRSLEHCISKGGDHVDAAALLGLALIDSEATFGEAIGLLHRASAVDPGHAAVQYGLGVLGAVQGQCAGSHAAFSNALAADPALPGAALMQRVIAYAMTPSGAPAEVLADLGREDYLIVAPILRMALGNANLPEDIKATFQELAQHTAARLAEIALRLLEDGDAASLGGRCLSQANQLAENLANVDIGAGLILFESGNFELAVMAFESGLTAEPGDETALRMLKLSRLAGGEEPNATAADYRRLGAICRRNRMFDQAEAFLRQAVARDPEDAEAARVLSEIQARPEAGEA